MYIPVSIKTTKLDGGKSSNIFDILSGVDSRNAGATYQHKKNFELD
jgi:hypothetical protein